MRSIQIAVAGTWLALALMLATPQLARACKCMMPSPEQAKEQAAAVFEGRVTAIDTEPAQAGPGSEILVVTLSVVRTWKGLENDERVKVRTNASTASCGIAFEKDASYLVYAGEGGHGLEAGSCGRTRPMADAGDDLALLGAGVTPVSVKTEAPSGADTKAPPSAKPGGCASTSAKSNAGASLMLVLPTFGLLATRRKRQRP